LKVSSFLASGRPMDGRPFAFSQFPSSQEEKHMKAKWTTRARRAAGITVSAASLLACILASPFLEKNPDKTDHSPWSLPMVFSMARVIVLAFAVAMIRQVERSGIAGWPEATLSIAIVLAIPIVNALQNVRAGQVVALARTLLERFGVGAVRPAHSMFENGSRRSNHEHVTVDDEPAEYGDEPSKYDDHRRDEASPYADEDAEWERVG
jgi:hypothetical protein